VHARVKMRVRGMWRVRDRDLKYFLLVHACDWGGQSASFLYARARSAACTHPIVKTCPSARAGSGTAGVAGATGTGGRLGRSGNEREAGGGGRAAARLPQRRLAQRAAVARLGAVTRVTRACRPVAVVDKGLCVWLTVGIGGGVGIWSPWGATGHNDNLLLGLRASHAGPSEDAAEEEARAT
jgi:hypothetical protein